MVDYAGSKSEISSNETAFPRGGATGLTPLEVKQISNEATSDVLFEAAASSKRKSSAPSDRPNKKIRKTKKGKKPEAQDDDEKEVVKIENFNFRTLIPGTSVLCQIVRVGKMDLTVSLGDNLVGYVPVTSISKEITTQVEKYAANEDDSSDDEEIPVHNNDEDDENTITTATLKDKAHAEFPELDKIFQVGQWVNARVTEPIKESKKKRIELTLDPEVLNASLEDEDLVAGNLIQGSIASVEDHGMVLNLGKKGVTGFISNKDLKSIKGLDFRKMKEGRVLLTAIQSKSARSLVLKPAQAVKPSTISSISSVDAIQTGITVNALISDVTKHGLILKVFGMVDATINLPHLNEYDHQTLQHKYGIGNNLKAKVIGVLLRNGTKKLILSQLSHILSGQKATEQALEAFPVGYKFEDAKVKATDPNYVYLDLGSSFIGQVHNSKIDPSKSLDTDYSVGSTHAARVVGFNPIDNLLTLSMDPKTINSDYLNLEDIPDGTATREAQIIKVLPDSKGIIIKAFNDFEGFVPPQHMSDVKLIYPERKFRVGSKVKARVLKKQGKKLLFTLKKSLVNIEDEDVLSSFENATEGFKTPATVEKFVYNGVIVSFFGNLSAFLPKVEISETFVNDARDYLKLGQTVNVKVLKINEDDKRLVVTLRQSTDLTTNQQSAISDLIPGKSIVEALIVEKAKDSVVIELADSNLRGVIFNGHLSDGNYEQNRVVYKKLNVGEKITGLVLEKDLKARSVIITCKQSLIDASKDNKLPSSFKDIKINDERIFGYVKSVTNMGIFVSFGGKLTGLVLAKYATDKKDEDLSKKFYKYQSVVCHVIRIDEENKRFLLSMKEVNQSEDTDRTEAINPVDGTTKFVSDFKPGKITKAVIKSVKGTQLNVQLAENLQGRIDITQCFNSWNEIKDRHQPLSQFHKDEVVDVKIVGYHEAKNHRFLPITHKKNNKNIILELSMLKEELKDSTLSQPTLSDLEVGSKQIVFVNNIAKGFAWVSLSLLVKGRISFMELTDDVSIFEDLDNKLPIGSAFQAVVREIDSDHNMATLAARKNTVKSIDDVTVGEKYPARVVKVKETFVLVELGEKVIASSFITDALNNYTEKLESVFSPNDYTSATVLAVDKDANKIAVSLRSDKAEDKLINSVEDLKRGDIVKGFVKNIANNGVYVSLGRSIHALIRVSDLSDSFLKEWKKYFKVNQTVTGKITNCEKEGQVRMTLKESEVNGELKSFKRFEDLEVDEILEGAIKSVTDFGVFVKLDGTFNVSGLCHHSQISDNTIDNLSALFGEGDRVKVKILKIDNDKKQLSLGMKASYFTEDVDMEVASAEAKVEEETEESDDVSEEEQEQEDANESDDDMIVDVQDAEGSSDEESEDEAEAEVKGLSTSGFDWTASILDQADEDSDSSDDEGDFTDERKKRRKHKGSKYAEDKTGDINTRAPQSVADFERLLVGNPNSSILWMNYMSFQLQLSEVDKAREIGERALKTINYKDENEKMNIWIAMLNLENSFGSEESLEETFNKSCQYMDSLVMHKKLAGIYIMSENFEKVDELYKKILKKFGSQNVDVWVNYGSHLMDRKLNDDAHELLSRALKSLQKADHVEVIKKFANMEFEKGEVEQGRSLYEGLVSDLPKRIDLWNVYIDKETKFGDDKSKVGELFERVLNKKINKKQAKFFFNKWVDLEEEHGDEKSVARVKAKAVDYASKFNKD